MFSLVYRFVIVLSIEVCVFKTSWFVSLSSVVCANGECSFMSSVITNVFKCLI